MARSKKESKTGSPKGKQGASTNSISLPPLKHPQAPKATKAILDAAHWFGTGFAQMYSRFQTIFGRDLWDFWIDNVAGLDIDKFDRELIQSDGKSLIKAVQAKYGREGGTIIKRLLPKTTAMRKLRRP